ncbi:hypothetical protein, partial [Streptomyces sp. NTH33]|uniref:hypothetical protein n=1 Tax=Streptomyces sp. NTH33 TaxID=1735453 RepID=UPI0021ABE426
PSPGTAVRDTARDRVGVVMGHEGPHLRLRPLSGGREWDAVPDHVQPLTPAELLRVRVAETNARSRQDLDTTGHPGAGRSPESNTFSELE